MERPGAPSRRPPLPPGRGSGCRSLDVPSAPHPSLCHLSVYSLGPFYSSRSAAFRSAGLTRCGLQPVCEERGTTRRRPGVVPPDKALGARREGVRESAGSGIREISDAQGARPRRPLRRGPQQAGSRRLLPGSLPRTRAAHSAARLARLPLDLADEEKAWIRKDGGEQRAFGRRRRYLIV